MASYFKKFPIFDLSAVVIHLPKSRADKRKRLLGGQEESDGAGSVSEVSLPSLFCICVIIGLVVCTMYPTRNLLFAVWL